MAPNGDAEFRFPAMRFPIRRFTACFPEMVFWMCLDPAKVPIITDSLLPVQGRLQNLHCETLNKIVIIGRSGYTCQICITTVCKYALQKINKKILALLGYSPLKCNFDFLFVNSFHDFGICSFKGENLQVAWVLEIAYWNANAFPADSILDTILYKYELGSFPFSLLIQIIRFKYYISH